MSKRTRVAQNARFRRIHYNPPGFRHWNNTELQAGAGVNWLYNSDESLTHVTGSTVQAHYVWIPTANWEGVIRRSMDPLPGENGIKCKATWRWTISSRTAGSCQLFFAGLLGASHSVDGTYDDAFTITTTSATDYYGLNFVPLSTFDGTVSLPELIAFERTG